MQIMKNNVYKVNTRDNKGNMQHWWTGFLDYYSLNIEVNFAIEFKKYNCQVDLDCGFGLIFASEEDFLIFKLKFS